jgi:prevent-host-death family protein
MRWKIAEAKRHFSEVVRAASDEPQVILNRDKVVAAVIDAATFAEYEQLRSQSQPVSLWEATQRLREIFAEENYVLDVGERIDRPNAFLDVLDELSD